MMLKNLQSLYICSCGKAANYSTVREARYLSKLINKGLRKKRLQNDQVPCRSSSISYMKESLKKKNVIRMSALNKIFMKHVTEILETNDCAEDLNKYGIKITKVLVTSDYNYMNVFWTNSRKMDESKANQILLKSAGLLRYELSALKIIGHIPEVQFLKDTEQSKSDELDRILNELSKFSEEHNKLKVNENEDNHIEANVKKNQLEENESLKLPVMSQNIFGLDRSKILKNILLLKAQSEAEKLRPRELCSDEGDKNSSNTWQFDKKLLSKIIFEKKYLMRKMMRNDKQAALIYDSGGEQSSGEEADTEDEEYFEDESEESKDA